MTQPLNIIIPALLIYLGSALFCQIFYTYMKKRLTRNGYLIPRHIENIGTFAPYPAINTLYTLISALGFIVGIFATIIGKGHLFRDNPVRANQPKKEDGISEMPAATEPPLSEKEDEIIFICESLDLEAWVPQQFYYQAIVGKTKLILQQVFSPNPPSYPITLMINDNFSLRHSSLNELYKKISDYQIKKAAEKRIIDLANKESIMDGIIKELKSEIIA